MSEIAGTAPTNAPLLALDAATAAGSVALWVDGVCTGSRDVSMGVGRDDQLFPAIQALLAHAGVRPSALTMIVCGEGPGSFTSLRIAASLAKGLAHGAGATLHAIPSLLVAAASLPADAPAGRYALHADALRGERYVLPVMRHPDGAVSATAPLARVPLDDLLAAPADVVGVGVLETPPSLAGQTVVRPSVANLMRCIGAWRDVPVDLATWEPVYGRLAEAQVKWEADHGRPLPLA